MKARINKIRGRYGMFVFYCLIGALVLYSKITQPHIDNLIFVSSIRVVALDPESIEREGSNCVISANEKELISKGDALFVAPDVKFLTNTPGSYRTSSRNLTTDLNDFDDKFWSAKIPYSPDRTYCKYMPLQWWVGREKQPEFDPGAHQLQTDWKFYVSPNRLVVGSYLSNPFVIAE